MQGLKCGSCRAVVEPRRYLGSMQPHSVRSYDTANEPELADHLDERLGFSYHDVVDAMLGGFAGEYSPNQGSPFRIEVTLGVDGLITVEDHDDGSVWNAPLMFAMSSDTDDESYLIDDMSEPILSLSSLDSAELSGSKPAAEFSGTLPADGEVALRASFSQGRWSGSLAFAGREHGRFDVGRLSAE